MCGRYAAARKDPDALVEEFEVTESLAKGLWRPTTNVAPTKNVYSVLSSRPKNADAESTPTRKLRVLRWDWFRLGLRIRPSFADDYARVETVAEKRPSTCICPRRCLLPADGYYDVTRHGATMGQRQSLETTQATILHPPVRWPILAMAGLYECGSTNRRREDERAWLLTATIITTSSTDELGRIHDRMPWWCSQVTGSNG